MRRQCKKQRFIDSSLADVVYCCSGTKLLPGQHITHALTLKSMTSSKRVVTLGQHLFLLILHFTHKNLTLDQSLCGFKIS